MYSTGHPVKAYPCKMRVFNKHCSESAEGDAVMLNTSRRGKQLLDYARHVIPSKAAAKHH
jgi:hypothetical protein